MITREEIEQEPWIGGQRERVLELFDGLVRVRVERDLILQENIVMRLTLKEVGNLALRAADPKAP